MSVKQYTDFYQNEIDKAVLISQKKNFGGKMREHMGALVENLLTMIWSQETGGYTGKQEESYTAYNVRGDRLVFKMDRFCYASDKSLRLFGECKTYLDRTFFQRADNDFHILKGIMWEKNVASVVFALERALPKETINFYMARRNIDKIFFLLDGPRNSARPIWKSEFRKSINVQKLKEFIQYAKIIGRV